MERRLHIVRLDAETAAWCSLCGSVGGHFHLDTDLRLLPGHHGVICPPCKELLMELEIWLLKHGFAHPSLSTPKQ